MLRAIKRESMGRGEHGWLDSHFHFSFAEYHNPENIRFGQLRVLNDDVVQPGTGFDTHPHKNMEIISYVVNGELSHADSMGNEHTLKRGQVQYMSAGTGVWHSEYNHGDVPLRFFQIWIFPDADDYPPNYGECRFEWQDRVDRWLPLASSVDNSQSQAPIKIHQDINAFASFLSANKSLDFAVGAGRQAYLAVAEGQVKVSGQALDLGDAMEIRGEDITVEAISDAHFLIIEMALSDVKADV